MEAWKNFTSLYRLDLLAKSFIQADRSTPETSAFYAKHNSQVPMPNLKPFTLLEGDQQIIFVNSKLS